MSAANKHNSSSVETGNIDLYHLSIRALCVNEPLLVPASIFIYNYLISINEMSQAPTGSEPLPENRGIWVSTGFHRVSRYALLDSTADIPHCLESQP